MIFCPFFPALGPNHGGRLKETVSVFEAFWVLMIQQNGLQVLCTHGVRQIGNGRQEEALRIYI